MYKQIIWIASFEEKIIDFPKWYLYLKFYRNQAISQLADAEDKIETLRRCLEQELLEKKRLLQERYINIIVIEKRIDRAEILGLL